MKLFLSLFAAGLLFTSSQAYSEFVYRIHIPGVRGSVATEPTPDTPPVLEGLAQFSGYRGWADGSLASSCKEYRDGDQNHTYSDATGDGVYAISMNGQPVNMYCDMTTAGGGWTRVAYLNQGVTTYGSGFDTSNPTTNWSMPQDSLPGGATGEKLIKMPSHNAWVQYSAGANSVARHAVAASWGAVDDTTTGIGYFSGNVLWSSGYHVPKSALGGLTPATCSTNASIRLQMIFVSVANSAGGYHPGLQIWQAGCNSTFYHETSVPFEVYAR